METKPGYKTTEFWLSLAATLLGFLMASGIMETVSEDSWIARLVGGIIAALASLGYSASRAKVKAAATETPSAGSGQVANDGTA